MWRILFVLLCCFIPAHACLWDSDTLATEAKGLPGTLEIITGRFERNPPLYYQMRLARVRQEIKTQPAKLELYDDAGVACDRLHKGDEAIAWMKQKRAHLKPFPQAKEHWYRYHANLGTFQAHRWLRNGANRKNIAEMKTARDNIKRAIQINPNAHFGREKYQLMAMEWIINPPEAVTDKGKLVELGSFIDYNDEVDYLNGDTKKITEGLTGLIVLGNAWESIDVFYALSKVMSSRIATMSYLSRLRCEELARQGKNSLYSQAPKGKELLSLLQPQEYQVAVRAERWHNLEKQFSILGAEAEQFQKRRTTYMMTRLKAGRHPDTDKTFWSEWKDPGPPPLPEEPMTPDERFERNLLIFTAFLIASIIGLFIYFAQRRKKRRLIID